MTISSQTPRVRMKNVCTFPEDGELLPAYIVDELDDVKAERMENHLNDCPRCKEHYLTILEAYSEAPMRYARMAENSQDDESIVPASPVEPVRPDVPEVHPSAVQRKGKASGS